MKVFVLIILLLGITLAASRCPSPNQVEVCNDDFTNCSCKNCLSCPPGYGQNYECGKQINIKQTLKCVLCDLGATYSSTNSSAMCQPCPDCDGHKMLRPCTTTSENKCSPDECDKGFVWNSMLEMCELGQKPTTKPMVLTQPSQSTTPKTSTHTPTSTPATQSSSNIPSDIQTSTSQKDHDFKKIMNDESNHLHPTPLAAEHGKKIQIILIVVVVIVVVVIIAAGLTGIYCWKINNCTNCQKCCKQVEVEKGEETVPLQVIQNSPPSRHQEVLIPTWPNGYLLSSISYNLQGQIQVGIANPTFPVKGWREIGEELNIDSERLDGIKTHERQDRGEQLFDVLKTAQPKLTLSKFVQVLVNLERNDIVEKIRTYFIKNNVAVKDSQQNISSPV